VEVIRIWVFPFIPVFIIAALAFLGDRAMEYSLIQREATLSVIIVSLLTLLVLVLLIYLQRKHRNKKGGPDKSNEQM
jgi:heme/copper-type cytochrome/quinol oxidase subunit 2